jgi:predicted transcriptional regulator of viral defense system
MKPDRFLAERRLFTRAELSDSLPGRRPATIDAHLARWRRQGRIRRVKNGLYVRSESAESDTVAPDFIALAGRMALDAAVSHHTALEAHGCAQSLFDELTFATWTRVKPVEFMGRRFSPVRPRAPLGPASEGEQWIEVIDRGGLGVRVTSVERTVVDVLDRPSLSGGMDEVWRSLAAVPAIDPESLIHYVRLLDNRTLAARVGFYLDGRREELAVPDSTLTQLQALAPTQPAYLDRQRRGRLVRRWHLFVPEDMLDNPGLGAL